MNFSPEQIKASTILHSYVTAGEIDELHPAVAWLTGLEWGIRLARHLSDVNARDTVETIDRIMCEMTDRPLEREEWLGEQAARGMASHLARAFKPQPGEEWR